MKTKNNKYAKINDYVIEPWDNKERKGMQPVSTECGIKVTHKETGIVVCIPHDYLHSQHKHLEVALQMFNTILGDKQ